MRRSIGTPASPAGTERFGRLQRRWFVVDGRRLHARVSVEPVPADAPAVVLVHGLGVASTYMVPTAARLAPDYPVYAPDLPGFGDAELAADFPDHVARLVLVDAALLPAGFVSPRQVLNLARAARRAPLRLLPTMVADAHRAGPATVWRATRELLAADLRPKLGRILAPTLVVWGDRDLVVPLATGQQLARDLPRAELAIIPGAGHVPMWERPEAFNRLVAAFAAAGTASPLPPIAAAGRPRPGERAAAAPPPPIPQGPAAIAFARWLGRRRS